MVTADRNTPIQQEKEPKKCAESSCPCQPSRPRRRLGQRRAGRVRHESDPAGGRLGRLRRTRSPPLRWSGTMANRPDRHRQRGHRGRRRARRPSGQDVSPPRLVVGDHLTSEAPTDATPPGMTASSLPAAAPAKDAPRFKHLLRAAPDAGMTQDLESERTKAALQAPVESTQNEHPEYRGAQPASRAGTTVLRSAALPGSPPLSARTRGRPAGVTTVERPNARPDHSERSGAPRSSSRPAWSARDRRFGVTRECRGRGRSERPRPAFRGSLNLRRREH